MVEIRATGQTVPFPVQKFLQKIQLASRFSHRSWAGIPSLPSVVGDKNGLLPLLGELDDLVIVVAQSGGGYDDRIASSFWYLF